MIQTLQQDQAFYYRQPTFTMPTTAQPASEFDIAYGLLRLLGLGLVGRAAYRCVEAFFKEPRDTYKYVYEQVGRVRHGGITYDLSQRERQHRAR